MVTQARHYQGQLAKLAVESVIECLISTGRLPQGYSPKQFGSNWLARKTPVLFGREGELERLRGRLCDPKHFPAAVIRGGCGDGKSALAMELGMQLWEAGELPGGAYLIDLAGEYTPAMPCIFAQESCARGQAAYPINLHSAAADASDDTSNGIENLPCCVESMVLSRLSAYLSQSQVRVAAMSSALYSVGFLMQSLFAYPL